MTVQLCTDLSKVIFCHVYVADNLVPIYNRRIHQGASFTDINWLAIYAALGDELNPLRPEQNGNNFADDISRCIFLYENLCIFIEVYSWGSK